MRAPVHSGEDRGAAHRLDRHHRRPRRDMRQRIDPAGIAHPQLAPHHDRVGLGMQRDALAGRRDDLEALQHRAGRGRRNRAERVAHVELEADRALGQLRHVLDGVLAEQPVEPEIDVRLLGRHLVLGREDLRRAGRRDRVRHVEHGGDAAERRRSGAAARSPPCADSRDRGNAHASSIAPGSTCMPLASSVSRAGGMAASAPTAMTTPSLIATLASITLSGETTLPYRMTRSAVIIVGSSQHGPAAIDRKVDAGDLARCVAGEEQAGVGDVGVAGDALERVFGGVALDRLLDA